MGPASYPRSRPGGRPHSTGCDRRFPFFSSGSVPLGVRRVLATIGIRHHIVLLSSFVMLHRRLLTHYVGVGSRQSVPSRSIAQQITNKRLAVATAAILRLVLLPPHTRSKIDARAGL